MTSAIRSTATEYLGHDEFRRALIHSAAHLKANYQILDRLNVFPVPDGDTGSNMLATFVAGVEAIADVQTSSIRELSQRMTPALLKHSRGNSGFIVARFFSGFFETAAGYERLQSRHISDSFANGSYHVTSSLFSPVEGTAITIISAMTRAMQAAAGAGPVQALRQAINAARETLQRTPDMLPVLARAGVVDSGALGFIMLFEGLLAGISGETLPPETEDAYRFPPRAEGDGGPNQPASETLCYRYCTEVVLSGFSGGSNVELKRYLTERGDSIALVADGETLKLHIHTNDPHDILGYLETMGTVENRKIEDMVEQVKSAARAAAGEETGQCAVLAIVPGGGFVQVFADLGIDHTLVYGDALPAAGEIESAVAAIPADQVVILPNNRNIIPAATIVQGNSNKDVFILPTEHLVQGLSASYGYSDNLSAGPDLDGMLDCLELADYFSVYQAVETTQFHQTTIRAGAYFVAHRDQILATADYLTSTVVQVLESFPTPVTERSNLTIFAGVPADEQQLATLETELRTRYSHLEVECHYGGQKRETVIISVE